MHAVCAKLERELDVVVDDHWHAELAAQAHDGTREYHVAPLLAVLQERDAALQRKAGVSLDVAALPRDRIEPAQLHGRKKRFGSHCPPPALKPVASEFQVKRCAACTASGGSSPRASSAAIAAASVQPEPW